MSTDNPPATETRFDVYQDWQGPNGGKCWVVWDREQKRVVNYERTRKAAKQWLAWHERLLSRGMSAR